MISAGQPTAQRVSIELTDAEFARLLSRARAEDVHLGGVYDLRGARIEKSAPRDLGNGLTLRWAGAADTERVAAFMARVFVDAPDVTPNPWAAGETRYLMSGHSTLLDAADFALVEEGDKIVAATCLIGQTWEYDGIAFDVGRPELVASDPDYR